MTWTVTRRFTWTFPKSNHTQPGVYATHPKYGEHVFILGEVYKEWTCEITGKQLQFGDRAWRINDDSARSYPELSYVRISEDVFK